MSPNETPAKPARKPPARAAAARPKAAPATSFETAFAAIGRKADEARARLGEMTDEGAKSASRSLHKASRATQAKLRKLNAQWKKLPPKKKATVLAGVLGAIAAAVAVPLVVSKQRKKRKTAPAEEPRG